MTKKVFIFDAVRTPVGRVGGGLSQVRVNDVGVIPINAWMELNLSIDWDQIDELIYLCANQAGEDNRHVGRMSLLLAGTPS